MYTTIPKPTGTPYTNVKNGYPLYDDSTVGYDDPGFFFDGDSPLAYTKLAKPIGVTWGQTNIPWNQANFAWGTVGYINVNKPT